MPYLTLDDQRLFYARKKGAPDRPTLVLIHGAGSSHLSWPAPLRRLPETAVYALDLPGHGRSDLPGRASVAAYADVVHAFLTELDLASVVLLGHSMGGAIAQELGLRQPDYLRGLILVGAGARLPVSDAILNQARTDFQAAVAFIRRYSWAPDTPEAIIDLATAELAKTDPEVLYNDFVACNSFDMREHLDKVPYPTLVIGGELDKMAPHKFSQFLADRLPQAKLVTIAGGGHMMLLEQPETVTAIVQSFLVNSPPAP